MNLTITTTVTGAAGQYTIRNQVSAGQTISVNEPIPAGSTNLPLAFAMAASKAKVLCINSTKNVTVKTNSSGSPANTFNITAGTPFIWPQTADAPLKDTTGATVTDITDLFVTNSGAADAQLTIDALVDPT